MTLLRTVRDHYGLLHHKRVFGQFHIERVAAGLWCKGLLQKADKAECKLILGIDVNDIHAIDVGCCSDLRPLDEDVGSWQRASVSVSDSSGNPPFAAVLRIGG